MAAHVLVVGGAGFIGSHVCKALARSGRVPVTFDNLSTGYADAVRFGPLVQGEMGDAGEVAAALRRWGIGQAILLGGFIAAGESVGDPAKYYDNNVGRMIGVLRGLRMGGVGQVVFSSSAAVYGNAAATPIREGAPIRPSNPYGWTKAFIEQVLADFAGAYGLCAAGLRYFNAAGSDPDGELGERHHPETHLIPLVLDAADGRRPAIEIYGSDYPTPDGTCIRDYVHVADLAEAHVLTLDWLAGQGAGGMTALNLGIGHGYSVRQVVEAAERVVGRSIPVTYGPRRPGDPAELVAAADRAGALLGWRPRFPDIETQIRHAWTWRAAHFATAAR